MNTRYGRSDRARTCGLNIPNVARYQLRHTPIYLIFEKTAQKAACPGRGENDAF